MGLHVIWKDKKERTKNSLIVREEEIVAMIVTYEEVVDDRRGKSRRGWTLEVRARAETAY